MQEEFKNFKSIIGELTKANSELAQIKDEKTVEIESVDD